MDNIQRLEDNIRGKLNNFPAKTRRVAEYILGNAPELALHSITETAEILNVSRAQLVRVARMLGFNGYADLKNSLQKRLLNQVIPSAGDNVPDDSSDIALKLCRIEKSNLDETYRNFSDNHDDIRKFCTSARNSDVIYCMGWGISSMPAEWLYTRFAELGLKSVLMRRGSLSLLEQARGIGENDMLIVCELPSYVIEVTEAASQIAERGTTVAAITDSPAAPICQHSDMHFYVSDNSPLFGSSLIGSMFAVHVLTSILAKDMGNEGKRALEEQRDGLSDERVYYPSFGLRY